MAGLRYEIIPTDDVADRLLRAFPSPAGITVTVTSLPKHGVERTMRTSLDLAERGFDVVPHLSARAIADRSELESLALRMLGSGMREAFVVSGDASRAAGTYNTSLELIRDLAEIAPELSLGVAGYPEGHPQLSDEHLMQHLRERAPFVDKVITQLCFSADAIGAYAVRLRHEGIELPLWVGVPGAIRRSRLISLSARIGVGSSLAFLKRSSSVAGDLMRSKTFDPAALVGQLEAQPQLLAVGLGGLHVYSFNEIEGLPEFEGLGIR